MVSTPGFRSNVLSRNFDLLHHHSDVTTKLASPYLLSLFSQLTITVEVFLCKRGPTVKVSDLGTVEPRFNEPLFNEVFDITNDILGPGQSYSKMYGIEPRYNEPRYNEFFDITNIIRKPERRIYLDITNYNVNTRQKINAELINSQQIL